MNDSYHSQRPSEDETKVQYLAAPPRDCASPRRTSADNTSGLTPRKLN